MIYLLFLPSVALFILNLWLGEVRERIGNGGSPIALLGGFFAMTAALVIFREWWAILFILFDYTLVSLFLMRTGAIKRPHQPYEENEN